MKNTISEEREKNNNNINYQQRHTGTIICNTGQAQARHIWDTSTRLGKGGLIQQLALLHTIGKRDCIQGFFIAGAGSGFTPSGLDGFAFGDGRHTHTHLVPPRFHFILSSSFFLLRFLMRPVSCSFLFFVSPSRAGDQSRGFP